MLGLYQERLSLPELSDRERLRCLGGIADLCTDPNKLNSPEMAVATLRTLLQMAPGDPGALDGLATLYRRLERWEDLVEVLQIRVTQAEESSAKSLAFRAEIARIHYIHLFHLVGETAVTELEQALSENPDDTETLHVLMAAYRDRGDLDRLHVLDPSQQLPDTTMLDRYLESLISEPEAEEETGDIPKSITLVFSSDSMGIEEAELVFEGTGDVRR